MDLPPKQGLYDPRNEHDACGVGFVANIKGRKSHAIVAQGLQILDNLDHRGAVGADPLMGDGAGILIQIPDALCATGRARQGVDLPPPGEYAVAMCFLPQDDAGARSSRSSSSSASSRSRARSCSAGATCRSTRPASARRCSSAMPVIRQVFVGRGPKLADQDAFERKLLVIRKQTQNPLVELGEEAQPARPDAVLHAVHLDAARWSTRACCSPTRSAASTTTCTTR